MVKSSYLNLSIFFLYLFFTPFRSSVADDNVRSEKRVLMGTTVEVQVLAATSQEADRAIQRAYSEMERIESLLTTYSADSEVSRLNAASGIKPCPASNELFEVTKKALEISKRSKGAFDISYRPLWDLWKKYAPANVPPDEEIREVLGLVGYSRIQLDSQNQTILLSDRGMKIDLGGIGKGYAVDRAIHVLKALSIQNALVNAGGDLRAIGSPGNRSWSVGIQHPRLKGKIVASLPIMDEAVVTSGDYERFLTIKGKKYAHIIDPRTGQPVDYMMSVTVIAPTATEADALSTALFVLGPEQGLKMIEEMKQVEAMLIDGQGHVFMSKGFRDK